MTMDRNGLFVIRRNRETASSKVRSEIKIVIFSHFWWKMVGLGYFEVIFGANFRSERSWVEMDGPWGLESNNIRSVYRWVEESSGDNAMVFMLYSSFSQEGLHYCPFLYIQPH